MLMAGRPPHAHIARAIAGAVLLLLAVAVPDAAPTSAKPPGPVRATGVPAPDPGCASPEADAVQQADGLMADHYALDFHAAVDIPFPPTWAEDPFGDRNWRFHFHSLDYLTTLLTATDMTGDPSYLQRAMDLAHSWLDLNPVAEPPSDFSWNDHSAALRAQILVCLDRAEPGHDWLADGLRLHARMLADPDFYVSHGNHALNQNIGLLEIGCQLGRDDWTDLAASRIDTLLRRSVDAQGVVDEQAVGYQLYNYDRYGVAREVLRSCGRPAPERFARVRRIPTFLGHATQPDGRYAMIGDTLDVQATIIPGTIAAFAASRGTEGPEPDSELMVFDRGYIFARTGWGDTRPITDEAYVTLRFGEGRSQHGHDDQGALTLYGYGSRLLLDAGLYAYEADRWRQYFQSREAHNAVVVASRRSRWDRPTTLLRRRSDQRSFDVLLDIEAYRRIEHRRRVVFSRRLGYLVVEDRLKAGTGTRERFSQLWHLREDSRPTIAGATVRTRRDRGNVVIRQLLPKARLRAVIGRDRPIQGWLSYRYRRIEEAPVVIASMQGREVRFLTLLVPTRGPRTRVKVNDLHVSDDGMRALIRVGRKTERIVMTRDTARITSVP
jgi:hypothetical protein